MGKAVGKPGALAGLGSSSGSLRTDMIHDERGWRGTGLPPAALTLPPKDAKGENTPITEHDTKLMVTNVFSRRRRRGGQGEGL